MTASSNASDPIVVTAIFHPADGSRDAVLAALEPAITAVHSAIQRNCQICSKTDMPV